jgi:pimeloyl-ACP methyl ester carboxylesterase
MGELMDVGGHPTWVDVRGTGEETLLLLHGGMSNSDLFVDALAPHLGDRYRLAAFDRRGHGYTPDDGRAFHYESMADETITVLESVVRGPAHLIGWSDGGIVGLLVARRRPDLVGRLVAIGANFHADGVLPLELDPSSPLAVEMFEGYAARSPDGADHFAVVLERFIAMMSSEPTLTTEDVATIVTPTLVLVGDDDLIRLDHTCALYEALPNAQLAVVPGTSHAVPVERPDEVARLVLAFLSGPARPETAMPVRRRERRT